MAIYTLEQLSRFVDRISEVLNGKLDLGCMNSNIYTPKGLDANGTRTVVETYINGTSGYRVWSDGYCEQWGITIGSGTTVTLLKTFANINYIILFDPYNGEASSGAYSDRKVVKNITTSSFFFGYTSGDAIPSTCSWLAKGYLA